MSFTVIIPARYASTRFPGKPLADIHGKPMVQHVYERAVESGASQVIVATDDQRIAKVVEDFNGQVCVTRADHESGTERLAEVVTQLGMADDHIVVNVQGDEPFIPPANIRQVAANLAQNELASMATLSVQIENQEDVFNPNVVKVLTDQHGLALYFSRAPIPYDRAHFSELPDESRAVHTYYRHIGIYAYSAGFIKRYVSWPASELEQIESLEQLRVLWQGENIHVEHACEAPPVGVDTPDDLQRLLNQESLYGK